MFEADNTAKRLAGGPLAKPIIIRHTNGVLIQHVLEAMFKPEMGRFVENHPGHKDLDLFVHFTYEPQGRDLETATAKIGYEILAKDRKAGNFEAAKQQLGPEVEHFLEQIAQRALPPGETTSFSELSHKKEQDEVPLKGWIDALQTLCNAFVAQQRGAGVRSGRG